MPGPLPPVVATFLADIGQAKANIGEYNSTLAKSAALSKTQMAEIEASVDRQVAEMAAAAKAAGTEFDETATKAELMSAKVDEASTKSSGSFGRMAAAGKVAVLGIAAGAAVVGVEAVKSAAQYQTLTTQLVTGAGESSSALKQVSDGMLKLAPQVGTGPDALAKSMFLVESAGYHGAEGLTVLKAASEDAKVGGADATVVANGLTTALTDYGLGADKAATVASQLNATVAAGKTNMQDLSSSLSTVLPSAAAAHLGLEQVLGAMGTMTAEGISAQQAANNLNGTIAALSNPSAVASKAMGQMGINSVDLQKNLGKYGLDGTLAQLTDAITAHMGPAGLVLQSSFNQSQLAAQSAQEELGKLPTSLQSIGKELLAGTITQKQWSAALKEQPVLVANLGKEFATSAKSANGFSDQLKAGKGSASTFNGIMSEMTGGQTGLQTALALSGAHMGTFASNIKTIGGTAADAKGNVQGWAETTKDFSFKVDQAKAYLQSMAIIIGQRAGQHFTASRIPLLAVWGRWDAEHYIGLSLIHI